ncbi:unnamed protein product [Rotaria sordida]|uniref:Uncharacterized protein n=1 Tax=Rotaria sordida TaxID=392033 RepID=A0A815SWL4_9BILA|nr:unnamed protein product [Rotaria sordida]CAF4191589.1 unnamed protein product [Rotaria sordida]
MKRVNDDTAEIMVYGRRIEATIEYRGTRDECRRVWEQQEKGQKSNNVDKAYDSENEKDANDDDSVVHLKSLSIKLMYNPFFVASSLIKHIDIQFNTIRQENEKQYMQLSKKIDRKHHFDTIDLSSFRESGQDQKFDDVIYKDINLTRIRGKNIGDYGRQVLRVVFSHEELISSILPPGGAQYARKPLDFEKFEFLHDATRSKYRIAADQYDEFFNKLVRPKLADFLADERKRDRKSTQT